MLLLSQILNKMSADLNPNSKSRHQMATRVMAAIPYIVGASDDYMLCKHRDTISHFVCKIGYSGQR